MMPGNREKIAITLCAGIVLLFLSYIFIISPLIKEIDTLDRKVRVKEGALDELEAVALTLEQSLEQCRLCID